MDSKGIKILSEDNEKPKSMQIQIIVSSVAGTVSLIGVAALVAGMVVLYTKRSKKAYEKLPLLQDE